jgi:hypothetical protein
MKYRLPGKRTSGFGSVSRQDDRITHSSLGCKEQHFPLSVIRIQRILWLLTARSKWLDETDRSQIAFHLRPMRGPTHFKCPHRASVTPQHVYEGL